MKTRMRNVEPCFQPLFPHLFSLNVLTIREHDFSPLLPSFFPFFLGIIIFQRNWKQILLEQTRFPSRERNETNSEDTFQRSLERIGRGLETTFPTHIISYSRRTRVALRFRGKKRGSVIPRPRSRNFPWIGRCCSIRMSVRFIQDLTRRVEEYIEAFWIIRIVWALEACEFSDKRFRIEFVNNKFCDKSILLLRSFRSEFERLERKRKSFEFLIYFHFSRFIF